MTLETETDALADDIAKKAREENTPLAEKIDALKTLTAYLIMDRKRPKEVPENTEEMTFDTFREELKGHANGATALRSD